MQRSQDSTPRQWVLWTLVFVIGVAAAGAVALDVYRRSGGMRPTMSPIAAVLAATRGSTVKAVIRLEGHAGKNTYSAALLEGNNGADYRTTQSHIRVALSADTALVMGGVADIKPGAVVQVTGTMDSEHALHASQIVILTGFVHLVPTQQ